jgi:hypothetical protein
MLIPGKPPAFAKAVNTACPRGPTRLPIDGVGVGDLGGPGQRREARREDHVDIAESAGELGAQARHLVERVDIVSGLQRRALLRDPAHAVLDHALPTGVATQEPGQTGGSDHAPNAINGRDVEGHLAFLNEVAQRLEAAGGLGDAGRDFGIHR